MKITENVSFNFASEASYVYILNVQKLIQNAKSGRFGKLLKTWSLGSNSVTRQVNCKRTKIVGKWQNWKIQINGTFWVIFKVFLLSNQEGRKEIESCSNEVYVWKLRTIHNFSLGLTVGLVLPDCSCKSHALSLPSSRVTSVHPQLLLPSTTRHHKENLESNSFLHLSHWKWN